MDFSYFLRIAFMCLFVSGFSCGLQLNGSSNVGSRRRQKRIFNGDKFTNRKEIPYKVIEYYVWIGHIHICYDEPSWWQRGLFGFDRTYNFVAETIKLFSNPYCNVRKEDVLCGGALITPRIVQTACHCLATLVVLPPGKVAPGTNLWQNAKLNNHFERMMQIFMGEIDVHAFQYPIRTIKFLIHQKCSQFSLCPKCIRYDIGWVVLNLAVPWQEGVLFGTWGKLDYAGPYLEKELSDVYNKAMGERHVCLAVGFGINEQGKVSRHMRQAWIQMLDWTDCRLTMYEVWPSKSHYNYSESATWMCAVQLPEVATSKFRGRHAEGDSGSPITCNNNYVAVITGFIPFKKVRIGHTEIMMETAISFAPEANSVEMRTDWQYDILRRNPPDELRVLRLPDGQMLKHPRMKYPELKKDSIHSSVIP